MKVRILLVDDDDAWLEVYVETLSRLGSVELVVERRSAQAAARLREEPFDLLLSDLDMPGTTGLDLLLMAAEVAPLMPVVIVTGHGPEAAASCVAHGAREAIHKPFLPEHLVQVVRRILSI